MGHIPDDDWATTVEHMPIPTVDLVIYDEGARRILLGRRENKPAQNTWFVPGGRIQKNERYKDAVHRIAQVETGLDVNIIRCLGHYQHFYDDATADVESGKHYTPVGYVVEADSSAGLSEDDQHEQLKWFHSPPKATHEYTLEYLEDAGVYPRDSLKQSGEV